MYKQGTAPGSDNEPEETAEERDELTTEEERDEEETGESGEEAHREGEFQDLRDRMERLESMIATLTEAVESIKDTAQATSIDNGAEFKDVDGDGDVEAIEEDSIPDYEDLDLDL